MDDASHANVVLEATTLVASNSGDFRYQKSEGFVTCFWINPTGSCCWIDRSCKLMGDPKLIARCTSGPMRRMTCCVSADSGSQWDSSLVGTEPAKCNKTRLNKNLRNWTGLMKVCGMCFFLQYRGELRRWKKPSKEVNCGPKQSAWKESLIWGWLVMLLWRWGGLGESDEFPTYKWSTTRSLFFCCPFPYKTPSNPGHGFGVCKWRNWMRDRLRSWIVGPWVVVFGMFTCRIRAWDYEVVPCILSAHGHNGENAKGRNEVIIIWQELSWDQRSKFYKWVVAEGNSLKVDRFKWLDMYLTYLWSFYVIKYLIDWCESFEKAYNWRKHVSTQPRAKKSADFQMLMLFQYITPFNLQTDMRIGMVGHSCLDCHRSSPIFTRYFSVQWGVYPIAAARRWTIGRH